MHTLRIVAFREKQPIPRKGTETNNLPKYYRQLQETTHTPQGDGNYQQLLHLHHKSRDNLYPARGRKTICVYIAEIVGETIHIPDRGQLTKKERETR